MYFALELDLLLMLSTFESLLKIHLSISTSSNFSSESRMANKTLLTFLILCLALIVSKFNHHLMKPLSQLLIWKYAATTTMNPPCCSSDSIMYTPLRPVRVRFSPYKQTARSSRSICKGFICIRSYQVTLVVSFKLK